MPRTAEVYRSDFCRRLPFSQVSIWSLLLSILQTAYYRLPSSYSVSPRASCLLIFTFSVLAPALGQTGAATLSGTVTDQNGAVVPGVNIVVMNIRQGFGRSVTTNSDGTFVVTSLPPSTYIVTAEREGFGTYETTDIVLNVNDRKVLMITLKIGDISQTVLVDGTSLIDESAAVVTTVDRQLVGNMPLNGRSFQSLLTLSPGVVLTRATALEMGQFSVNGQRADANYFTIDGVSANIGVLAANVSQPTAGTLPGFSVSGGTNNLVSIDALEEFKIQTSTYAAEFGRQPGAQVQVATRSGTNEFHGAIFNYFRNDVLDANNWFNNARRLRKPATRQNDFGAVFGGPILLPRFGEGEKSFYHGRNRSFFFFSYEGLRLRQPQAASTDVPTLASRQNARAELRPFLSVFPLPNGPNRLNPATGLPNGYAQFNASFSVPSTLNATSIRIDHLVSNKLTLFARYNHAPSEIVSRGTFGSLSVINPTKAKTQTLTIGAISPLTPALSNDFRFNWSRNSGTSWFEFDGFGGASIPDDSLLLPPFASNQNAQLSFFLEGASFIYGRLVDHLQRQLNIVDSVSSVAGKHQLKFGVDYRRLVPVVAPRTYGQSVSFSNLAQTVTGVAASVILVGEAAAREPVFTNLSLYGQDTWRLNDRLTLTYGLRWELNPPPSERNGNHPATVQGLGHPATASLAPLGTQLYETTYNNFAPRIGIAYRLGETILRGGAGIFYDLGTGTAGGPFLAGIFPYGTTRILPSTLFPLTPAQAAPPMVNLTSPAGIHVNVFDPDLKLPKTYQWNFAVERSLGPSQTASASYVGAAGRQLLRQERLNTPNATFASITNTRNTGTSDYHALQLQFQRRLSRRLQGLASYSWAKSLDNISTDSFQEGIPGVRIDPQNDRGPSDFDIRHAFNAAVIYSIPRPSAGRLGNAILSNWSIDTILTARSATPVNVIIRRNFGFGNYNFRPDLIPGIPLYIDDPAVPGGRRFNNTRVPGNTRQVGPFFVPAENRQGSLGRNVLRGFSVYQTDFALRRQFNLTERVNLQFKAEIFNIFNHPNFGDPIGSLGTNLPTNPQFGLSDRMFGQSLGTGGTSGGFNPLYQIGGPRSIQLSLKVQF